MYRNVVTEISPDWNIQTKMFCDWNGPDWNKPDRNDSDQNSSDRNGSDRNSSDQNGSDWKVLFCHGLTCKLLQLLPDRHMVHMIMEMVGNRSFIRSTRNGKRSRLRRLKNGVPQGSVLVPPLFNIYISDFTTTVSRKYAYADNVAITHADRDLAGSGRGVKPGQGNCRWIPPDLKGDSLPP